MPSTLHQFLRVLVHERPLFFLKFAKNFGRYGYYKYALKSPELIKKIHNFSLALSLTDPGISRSLLLVGDREREHRYMLERILCPDDTVLDLGANIGYYVLMELKLMQGRGHVIAIEPSPDNFRRLQQNIHLNQAVSQTTLIEAAVTENDGQFFLNLARLSNVHSLLPLNNKSGTGKSLAVAGISLATIAGRFPAINLIRMDVEGYEQTILASLVELNKKIKFRPNLLFEIHAATYNQQLFSDILQNIAAMGYRARYLASSNKKALQQEKCQMVAAIQTDGTTRYIARDVPLDSLLKLYSCSRAVLLIKPQP